MADVQIDQDAANIPAVNLVNGSGDPTAPGSGHGKLYLKEGVAYVRLDTGDPAPVGGSVALAEGQLAVGDGSGLLSALGLGTEGDVVTADENGMATWAAPPGGAGGDLVKIATSTVGAGGSATVTFSNIPQTYRHLEVFFAVRGVAAGFLTLTWHLVFNADTSASYNSTYIFWNQSAGSSNGNSAGGNNFLLGEMPASDAVSGAFSVGTITIPVYALTVCHKAINGKYYHRPNTDGSYYRQIMFGGVFVKTDAIASLTFSVQGSGTYAEGSTFDLYGRN